MVTLQQQAGRLKIVVGWFGIKSAATDNPMDYNYERANKKKEELIRVAEESLLKYLQSSDGGDSAQAKLIATETINHFAKITPPEQEHPTFKFELLRMDSGGRGGAQSVKAGNLLLNMHKLVTAVAGGVLAVAGIAGAPWTAPFAAIMVWESVWSGLKIDISEREAAVLWTLWTNSDGSKHVPADGLLDSVNSELAAYGRSAISQQELEDSLEALRRINCIDRSGSDRPTWWLREWVEVGYE